ncbi:MAG: hypothetical protein ACOYUK_05820 [Patescibacteria group bacterium]
MTPHIIKYTLGAALLSLILPIISLAQTNTDSVDLPTRAEAIESYRQARETERVATLQQLGNTLISRRIDALNTARTRLEASSHLTNATVATVQATLDERATALLQLRETIQTTDDLDLLKQHVREIVDAHRIYMVVLPQTYGLALIDRMYQYATSLSALNDSIIQYTSELQTSGVDVQSLQAATDDARANISAAQHQLADAQSQLLSMRIPNPDEAREYRSQAQQQIASARDALRTTRATLDSAVAELKNMLHTDE